MAPALSSPPPDRCFGYVSVIRIDTRFGPVPPMPAGLGPTILDQPIGPSEDLDGAASWDTAAERLATGEPEPRKFLVAI